MLLNLYKPSRGKSEDGFTLIELLIVIVIIGILAAIAIPIFLNQQNAAHDASVKSDARNTLTGLITAMTLKPAATGFVLLGAKDVAVPASLKLGGVPMSNVTIPSGEDAVIGTVSNGNWVTITNPDGTGAGSSAGYLLHAQSTVDGFWYEFSSDTGHYVSSKDSGATPKVVATSAPNGSLANVGGVVSIVSNGSTGTGTGTGGTGTGTVMPTGVTWVNADTTEPYLVNGAFAPGQTYMSVAVGDNGGDFDPTLEPYASGLPTLKNEWAAGNGTNPAYGPGVVSNVRIWYGANNTFLAGGPTANDSWDFQQTWFQRGTTPDVTITMSTIHLPQTCTELKTMQIQGKMAFDVDGVTNYIQWNNNNPQGYVTNCP